jgi:hypothetical protein
MFSQFLIYVAAVTNIIYLHLIRWKGYLLQKWASTDFFEYEYEYWPIEYEYEYEYEYWPTEYEYSRIEI